MSLVLFVHRDPRVLWQWRKALTDRLQARPVFVASIRCAEAILSHNSVAAVVCPLSTKSLGFCAKFAPVMPAITFLTVRPEGGDPALERFVESGSSRLRLAAADHTGLVRQIEAAVQRHGGGLREKPVPVDLRHALKLAVDSTGATLFRVEARGRCGHVLVDQGEIVDASRGRGNSREAAFELCNWEDANVVAVPIKNRATNKMHMPLRAFLKRLRQRDLGRTLLIREVERVYLKQLLAVPRVTSAALVDLDNHKALVVDSEGILGVAQNKLMKEAIIRFSNLLHPSSPKRTQRFDSLSIVATGFEVVVGRINAVLALLCVADGDDAGPEVRMMTSQLCVDIRDQFLRRSTDEGGAGKEFARAVGQPPGTRG
jgi:hypothetical protein